ncbi:(2Fe-2S)-binding protein [Thalassobaculum sp. OXR-137]|uniref:(2Fe-2S)-binding protein n=1 Tax=Thalassobaculum sp. OXR-137 TaxID=3100173 RepID=UPI002AC8B31E|nr:(2Fe-2S)-binding protein [Thalassobaculum sp. OXR-137]WPZ34205.1 (2Fe-2S)-binding protein [Thalassobaculum sp. OXR-137]
MSFARLPGPTKAATITLTVDGDRIAARDGDTVASALLASGRRAIRRAAVTGEPRAPYCQMGVCFECLVEIDGVADRQACLVPVRNGMVVTTERGEG